MAETSHAVRTDVGDVSPSSENRSSHVELDTDATTASDSRETAEDVLIEDVSIDGMCGVY